MAAIAGMAGPGLRRVAVAADILDDRVFAQLLDVEPGAGGIVQRLAAALDAVADGDRHRVVVGAQTAGLAVHHRFRDLGRSRRGVVPPGIAGQIGGKAGLATRCGDKVDDRVGHRRARLGDRGGGAAGGNQRVTVGLAVAARQRRAGGGDEAGGNDQGGKAAPGFGCDLVHAVVFSRPEMRSRRVGGQAGLIRRRQGLAAGRDGMPPTDAPRALVAHAFLLPRHVVRPRRVGRK